jgi:hypothetical protein
MLVMQLAGPLRKEPRHFPHGTAFDIDHAIAEVLPYFELDRQLLARKLKENKLGASQS